MTLNAYLIFYRIIVSFIKASFYCKLHPYSEEIMKTVMSIINFICTKSSLQYRLFKALFQENYYILFYNNVRWLSKENFMHRFFNLLNEIIFNSEYTFDCQRLLQIYQVT
jgi:hypothetical protein